MKKLLVYIFFIGVTGLLVKYAIVNIGNIYKLPGKNKVVDDVVKYNINISSKTQLNARPKQIVKEAVNEITPLERNQPTQLTPQVAGFSADFFSQTNNLDKVKITTTNNNLTSTAVQNNVLATNETPVTETEVITVQGPAGPQGPQGLQGPAGPSVPSGAYYIPNYTTPNFSGAVTTDYLSVNGNANIVGALSAQSLSVQNNLTVSGTIFGNVAGTINPQFITGSVLFQGTSGLAEDNSNFYWDDTNNWLGIGTTTPRVALDVIGQIQSTNAKFVVDSNYIGPAFYSTNPLVIRNPNTTDGSMTAIQLGTTDVGGVERQGAKITAIFTSHNSNAVSADLAFSSVSAGTLFEGLRLNSAGNVGIGTTTPAYTLDVQGKAGVNPFNITSSTGANLVTVLQNGYVGIGTSTPNSILNIYKATGATSVTLESGDGGSRVIAYTPMGALSSSNVLWEAGVWYSPANVYGVRTWNGSVNTYPFSILNTGNVGIGTTTPAYTLDVQGTAGVNPFNISSSTGSSLVTVQQNGYIGFGTTTPEFRLTIDSQYPQNPTGGILAKGNYLYGETLTTSGAGTRMIWYPRKAAFRAGKVDTDVWDDSNIGTFSVAFGENTKASGAYSFAAGVGSEGSANYTTALGRYVSASGTNSTAIGIFNTAGGSGSITIGTGINGFNRLVNNINNSLMVGFNSTIPTLFVGPSSGAGTTGNVGIGTTTPAYTLDVQGKAGVNPFNVTSSTGANLVTVLQNGNVGIGTSTPAAALVIRSPESLGQVHIKLDPWSSSYGEAYTAINSAGAGSLISVPVQGGETAPYHLYYNNGENISALDAWSVNGLTFDKIYYLGGKVGIGTTTPQFQLTLHTVSGGSNYDGLAIGKMEAGAGTTDAEETLGRISFYGDGDASVGAYIQATADRAAFSGGAPTKIEFATAGVGEVTPSIRMVVARDGNVGIGTTTPTYLFHVYRSTDGDVAGFTDANGTCTINPTNTALSCTSDARLKKDVSTIGSALDKIMQMRGITFHWLNQTDDTNRFGLLAQEVEAAVPELVSTNSEGFKSVNYTNVIPFLVEAIRELQNEIQALSNSDSLQGEFSGNINSPSLSVDSPIVSGNLTVKGQVIFNQDTVGQVLILSGDREVRVNFSQNYSYPPVVNITPVGEEILYSSIRYTVSAVDVTGFTVKISYPSDLLLKFNWTAFASDQGKLFVSDGSLIPLNVVVSDTQQYINKSMNFNNNVNILEQTNTDTSTANIVNLPPEVTNSDSSNNINIQPTNLVPIISEIFRLPENEIVK
jgi:hypothetical protein